MAVTVVQYRTKPERADENQAYVEAVFAELAAGRPDGLRYMTIRLDDGESFVHVASVETADGTNPLPASVAFQEFQREIGDRVEEGPVVTHGEIIGAYGFATVERGTAAR